MDRTIKKQEEEEASSYDLIDSDILFALALHVLVVGGFLLFALYHPDKQKKPLKRIEVNMITAKDLAKLQRPDAPVKPISKPAPQTPKHAEPKHAEPKLMKEPPQPVKPIVPELIQPTLAPPKAIVPKKSPSPPKPDVKKIKPSPKAPPKPVKAHPSKAPSNLFAPAVSKRNHQPRHSAPKIDRAALVRHQLSSRELDRYIAMMQAAVQKQWHVPGGLPAGVKNPLVRVELARDGNIQHITILETSGVTSLDQTLITAIRAAAPFTLPREQYAVFKINEIRFHPRQRAQ